MSASSGGKKGAKRKGRPRKARRVIEYYTMGNYFKNKLRRILKHNGIKQAQEWAKNHVGSWGLFEKMKVKYEH